MMDSTCIYFVRVYSAEYMQYLYALSARVSDSNYGGGGGHVVSVYLSSYLYATARHVASARRRPLARSFAHGFV